MNDFSDFDVRAVRSAAFADVRMAFPLVDILGRPLGPRVVMLTPARFNLLALCAPNLARGNRAARSEILLGLWLLSARYSPVAPVRAWLFRLRWLVHSWSPLWCGAIAAALERWHRLQFVDAPGRQASADGDAGQGSDRWLAASIDTLARRIPWLGAAVMDVPYARIFQILSEQDNTGDLGKPRFNKKRDRQAKAYLERKSRERAAAMAA